MKRLVTILFAPLAGCMLPAQERPLPPPMPAVAAPVVVPRAVFTAEQLDVLLGPIALYPDPLLAIMLPASTTPSDVVLAARYLQAGGNPNAVDGQPWDDAVKSLAHYPEVVRWMDENLTWTNQLGTAFLAQPDDVMSSVQRLRARARAAGTLMSTPQQTVAYEGSTIVIVPAQPDVIYVPYYDPSIVYYPPRTYYSSPSMTYFGFSSGFAAGWWMSYGLDWGERRVWVVDRGQRERYWREHRSDWNRGSSHSRPPSVPEVRHWQPHPDRGHYVGPRAPGAPSAPPSRSYDTRRNDGQRHDGDRNDNSYGRNSPRRPETTAPVTNTPPADFVGPRPMPAAAPVSAPPPRTAPPLPQASATPTPTYDRGYRGDRGDRNRSGSTAAAPTPSPSTPVAGPSAPVHQNRHYTPAPAPSVQAAPPPRSAPPLHVHTAPAAPAPAPAPSLPMAAQAQPAPAPQPQQQQQSAPANNNDDDRRRRPPFVRPN